MEHETEEIIGEQGGGRRLLLTYYLSLAFSRLLALEGSQNNDFVLEGKRGGRA